MLFESLFAHADSKPNDVAILDDRGPTTWSQLGAAAAGLGMYLSAQTTKPRVGLLLPTSAGFVASFYGTLLAGKAVVPINFLLSDREIAHCIADSGVDTIVTIPPLAAKLKDAPLKVVDLTALPTPPPAAVTPKFPQVTADDVAVVMYTSGTSGLPKGVMLTFGNLTSDVDAAIEHAQLKGQHKFLGVIPLFHSTGMLATLITPVRLGATVVYQARFSPVNVVKAIREHGVSIMAAVPSMYGAIARLKEANPDDVKTMYAALSGGEPLPSNVREGFEAKFGIPLYEGYGLTETIGPIAINVPGHRRPGSVGRLIPGASAKIVGDDGKPADSGEVWLKGPMIMKGYLNRDDATKEVLTADGYFKTGDLGHVDADGYLFITGRKKDLIIVAGEKVTPREIEEAILTSQAVADVAVVGRKDPSRGEAVVAFVIAKEGQAVTPEQVKDACKQQGLPGWKTPRDVYIVNDLPRSPTGKVLKRVLVEQLSTQAV
ncbi:MAG TPA: AMP-binding protein [Tepidisphaeraceae bacterium]|nr:AMP-binding protein [Tepidisphaeraceae bacterium]